MQSETVSLKWAEALKRLKLDGLALWLLEAGAPLTALGAQALYMTQPFLGGKDSNAIARMLENDEETQAFTRLLQGERSS
ncbi:MAG: hypothetical protein IT314_02030 [Anaerolineales bacterium]|nr:hypothetical protein [Anaerolineales bacterium]